MSRISAFFFAFPPDPSPIYPRGPSEPRESLSDMSEYPPEAFLKSSCPLRDSGAAFRPSRQGLSYTRQGILRVAGKGGSG